MNDNLNGNPQLYLRMYLTRTKHEDELISEGIFIEFVDNDKANITAFIMKPSEWKYAHYLFIFLTRIENCNLDPLFRHVEYITVDPTIVGKDMITLLSANHFKNNYDLVNEQYGLCLYVN
jgi:hypothetical protein